MTSPRTIPTNELANVAWRRIIREFRTRIAPHKPTEVKIGVTVKEIAATIRERRRPRFFGLIPEQAALLARFFPEVAWETVEQANQIVAHEINVLGSGNVNLGRKINWHRDFIHKHEWPVEHHTRLKLVDPDGGFDVKVPWELSRFHHTVRMGQAYLYTGDEKFSTEIVAQITDWIESNPVNFGVNWAGPMDVAIRAVNWLWSVYMIIESDEADEAFLERWLASLREHGEYLIKNLEDGWPRTNHLLANLAGLAYLGVIFPEFPEAERWRSTGLNRFWEEIEQQVYPDGTDYEASTGYHRLVTEMALSVAALCVVNDIEIPEPAQARMRAMLDVIMTYTPSEGMAPAIGDADDGRFVPLTVHPDHLREINDHRHLLALGSLVLEREMNEWAGFVEPTDRGWSIAAGYEWQDAFWYFASDAAARITDVLTRVTPRPSGIGDDDWVDVEMGVRVRARALAHRPVSLEDVTESRGFEAGGLYIMRHDDFHMVIDGGAIGQAGVGGHAHNDTLSFTLSAHDKPFIIDPGSYVYTSDPAARNEFRSTAAHNTLQIGNEEINRMSEKDLFRLSDDAQVTVHRWVSQPAYDFFDASHNGYARLAPGIIHRRQFWFDKSARIWLLHDRLDVVPDAGENGSASEVEHDISLWFHFAPLTVRIQDRHDAIYTEEESGPNLILLPLGDFPLKASLDTGFYAPQYGVRREAPVAKLSGRVKLPVDLVVLLYPHQTQTDFQVVRAAGQTALINFRKVLSPASRLSSRAINENRTVA